MADASCTSTLTNILPYVGSLFGVVVGAGLTWLLQRNEWDRQRQWELKRDAVIDVIRDASQLRDALTELCSAFNAPNIDYQRDTGAKFDQCEVRFRCSKSTAEAVAGKELSKCLDDFHHFVRRVFGATNARNSASLREINVGDELANKTNAVIRAARKELKIKDEDNLSLIASDH